LPRSGEACRVLEQLAALWSKDIYAVTAPLVVEAAQRLLSGQARKADGALAPGELFDARAFLSALSRASDGELFRLI